MQLKCLYLVTMLKNIHSLRRSLACKQEHRKINKTSLGEAVTPAPATNAVQGTLNVMCHVRGPVFMVKSQPCLHPHLTAILWLHRNNQLG